ncbi:MAG TPA: response regulator transcription factor [Candidatus Saccharimonadia bacterium]|jgi:DNA-binding response OmpR family regulator|nr:response regulator transcription factor [Candidatus Saccharimonadia bacterium]
MRILVVEDEHKIAAALKRGLEQESYAVDVAYDGDEGLSNALTDEYDVIVLDRMLPGLLDGADICREVRANNVRTPIIMLTAKDKVSDRVEGLNAGADDYLVKPFAFEELLARIRALLRRPQDHVGNVLQLDDLTMDTETYEVKRAGRRIQLSQREYALLEYLLRNQNRILSKSNIISHVWDYDADILPNTLEVYIGYLRSKIERTFKGPDLIHTVRGFGYKLAASND